MLKIGEKVLYGAAGACTVTDICTKKFGDAGEREYYVLVPVYDSRTTLYVPVDNEALQAKIRKLLSAEEIDALISSMPAAESSWISDEKARQEYFKNTLRSGDRRALIGMTKSLYVHRNKVLKMGRKPHMADERMFKEAEKLICDEFAVVLGMEPGEVLPYIMRRLEAKG